MKCQGLPTPLLCSRGGCFEIQHQHGCARCTPVCTIVSSPCMSTAVACSATHTQLYKCGFSSSPPGALHTGVFGVRDLWGMFSSKNPDGTREPKGRRFGVTSFAQAHVRVMCSYIASLFVEQIYQTWRPRRSLFNACELACCLLQTGPSHNRP